MMSRFLWGAAAAICFLMAFSAIVLDHPVASFLWWTLGSFIFVYGAWRTWGPFG